MGAVRLEHDDPAATRVGDPDRAIGRDFGVTYAEGFRHYRHEPYPRDPALEALLGDAVLALPAWPADD